MTYDSRFNHQPEKLINPAFLCLVLSIIVHVVALKFGLPNFKSEKEVGRRKVAVIELSPEQQSRLPKLSPQLQTPDVPSDLPPIDNSEAAPSFAIPRSLIPGIGDPSQLPAINIPPPPNFNFPDLPPITDITLPPIGDVGDLPLPPEINIEDFKVDPTKIPPPSTKTPVKPNKPVENQPKPPSVATNKKPDNPTNKPAKKPPVKQNLTPKPVAKKADNSRQRIANLQQSLTNNDAGTTDEEARKNYVLWLAKVKEIEPKEIIVKGIYPRDACIRRLKGNSIFGVVVNGQGAVVAQDLLKGSNYPIFNKQGRDDVGTLVLDNKTEQPRPYRVKVQYEYDSEICPSLTLPSIRKAEDKPESQPSPEIIPESKPESQPTNNTAPESKPASQPTTNTAPESKPESQPATESVPESKPASQPATESVPESKPESQPATESAPESKPESQPATNTAPESKPESQPTSEPSLKDQLRDIKLPDRNPLDLKDVPLPEKPNFNK